MSSSFQSSWPRHCCILSYYTEPIWNHEHEHKCVIINPQVIVTWWCSVLWWMQESFSFSQDHDVPLHDTQPQACLCPVQLSVYQRTAHEQPFLSMLMTLCCLLHLIHAWQFNFTWNFDLCDSFNRIWFNYKIFWGVIACISSVGDPCTMLINPNCWGLPSPLQ